MLCLSWLSGPVGEFKEFFLVSDDSVPTESILGKILHIGHIGPIGLINLPTEPGSLFCFKIPRAR
jgi:hypothetical protein